MCQIEKYQTVRFLIFKNQKPKYTKYQRTRQLSKQYIKFKLNLKYQ